MWLRDNIDALGEALDIVFATVSREQAAGTLSVDLVAEDEAGEVIVIENQLERSDHDHLGKLITYLAQIDASVAIWIVSEARSEHITALKWLNELGPVSFFLVKIEAVRIEDSAVAPLFTIVVAPTEENAADGITEDQTGHAGLRMQWWATLIKRSESKTRLHAHIQPNNRYYIGVTAGIPGLTLRYVVAQGRSSVELYIDRGKDQLEQTRLIFDGLHANRQEIEERF